MRRHLSISLLEQFYRPDKAQEDALGCFALFQPLQTISVLSSMNPKTLGDPDSRISIPPNVVPTAELGRGSGWLAPNCLLNCVIEMQEHHRPTEMRWLGEKHGNTQQNERF
jgi:hypothetical protein